MRSFDPFGCSTLMLWDGYSKVSASAQSLKQHISAAVPISTVPSVYTIATSVFSTIAIATTLCAVHFLLFDRKRKEANIHLVCS